MKIEDILGPFVYKQLFPVTSRLVNLNLKESLIMSKRIFLTFIGGFSINWKKKSPS